MKKKQTKMSGQVMLLSIMILGGVMLSASVIAGVLLWYQVRQVNDAVSSAKAIFAADAGIEFISRCFTKGCDEIPDLEENPPPHSCPDSPLFLISSGENAVSFEGDDVCFEIESSSDEGLTIHSRGYSGKTVRILEAQFISE